MEKGILCMLIDADRDDQELFRNALLKINRENKCLYFSHCLEADLYLRTPGSETPHFIFVDTYHPFYNEEYCGQAVKEWRDYLSAPNIIIYTAFISQKLFDELEYAGISDFLLKTSSITDLVSQLDDIFIQ